MDGERPSRTRQSAKKALLAAGAVAAFELVVLVPAFGSDVPSIAINVLMTILIGFPILFLMFVASERARSWWGRRRPRPVGTDAGGGQSFHFSGRNWRQALGLASLGAFFLLIFAVAGFETAPEWFLPLLAAFAAGLVSAALVSLRERTFEVDAVGVRVGGRIWGNFDVQWALVKRVEVWTPPPLPELVFLEHPPRAIRLLGAGGSLLGHVVPQAEIGQAACQRFEAALLDHASRRGVETVPMRWTDRSRWATRKRHGAS